MHEEGSDVLTPKAASEQPLPALKRARMEWVQRAEYLAKEAAHAEDVAHEKRKECDTATAVASALTEQWERFAVTDEPRNGAVPQLAGYR